MYLFSAVHYWVSFTWFWSGLESGDMPHNKRMQRTAKPLRVLSAADARRYASEEIKV